ncbi:DUF167 domain-containing protein [Candidatus Entotheonella palauensis]|uniref:DUF167 domain-containing protein n=1 Tax=Candidatus Entotheonella palauensis TaxID=93172 RepID=UPI000B7ECE34|nr:DUF167 domain-containing protein [Candidatus Entotheonella palauensis]
MAVLRAVDGGVLLRLRVQPRSRAERLEGVQGEQLRVRLTAPPVDGAANAACLAFLAKTLGVSRSRVQIRTGAKGRDKVLYIADLTPEQVALALGIAEDETG